MVPLRDPLLISVHEPPVPEHRLPLRAKEEWYGTPDQPKERTHKQVLQDLIIAFDQQHNLKKKQRQDRDLLLSELVQTKRELARANTKIWVLALIVSPVIGEVVKFFIHKLL